MMDQEFQRMVDPSEAESEKKSSGGGGSPDMNAVKSAVSSLRKKPEEKKKITEALGEQAGMSAKEVKKALPEAVKKAESGKVDDDSSSSIVAKLLIGLGPSLIGGLVGGSEGAAIGAQSGMNALHGLEEQERADAQKKAEQEEAIKAQQRAEEQRLDDQKREDLKRAEDRKFDLLKIDIKNANDLEKQRLSNEAALQLALLKGKNSKVPKPTERQAATFSARISQAENVFDQLQKDGFDPTSIATAASRYLPDFAKGENIKRQEQAERNFINAVLRRESGAAISSTEFESGEQQYFPRPGDTPEVLRQKKLNRLIALKGLEAEAGDQALGEVQTLLAPLESQINEERIAESKIQSPSGQLSARLRGSGIQSANASQVMTREQKIEELRRRGIGR